MTILRALKANAQPAFVTSRTEEFVILGQKSEQAGFKYLRPGRLGKQLAQTYEGQQDQIFTLYSQALPRLVAHIRATQKAPESINQTQWQALSMHLGAAVAGNMLPLSSLVYRNSDGPAYRELPQGSKQVIHEVMSEHLADTMSGEPERITLLSIEPRNNLELVRDIMFENASQPAEQVEAAFDNLNYQERRHILTAYQKGKYQGPAMRKRRYEFEIVDSLMLAREIQYYAPGATTQYQEFTPRHGYAVPELIEQAGETENYEQAFDLSYQLYAALQSEGKYDEAELSVLLGHRTRWRLSIDHFTLMSKPKDNPLLSEFFNALKQVITQSVD